MNGASYSVIGSFGRDLTNFNEPSGITVDRYGNMLIADSKNDRIHVMLVFLSLSQYSRRLKTRFEYRLTLG